MEKPWLKHIAEGNPREIDIPDISLLELFQQSARKYAHQTAMTYYHKTFTYQQLEQMIENAAYSLSNLGVQKGDRVALMLPNCPQYPIAYYAALACGATVVQINPLYKSSELLHVLNDSGATVMFVLDQMLPTVEEVKEHTSLTAIIPASFESGSKFDEFLQDKGGKAPVIKIDSRQDIAVLQYTGGTTGRSKGAMLTHNNLVANTLQSYATAVSSINLGEERVLSISPLFHVYGMTSCMNLTFYIGGNLILIPRFNPEEVVSIIEQTKPTVFPGVPTMYIALLNYHKVKAFDLSCLKTCSSGSAPLPIEVLKQFNESSGTKVAEGFGLSEASPVTHRNPISGMQKAGSIGIPIPNTDSKVVDPATGETEMAIGQVGELIVKGPQVMQGYWNMPEETENTLRDGWLYTGDLAKMDEDGYFYIIGRKKELIIASGYNVYPIEVEDVLYSHPKVLEAAVVGVPDPYRGETVKAFVVLKDNDPVTEAELISFCRDQLASYKIPRSVEFLKEFPKTAVGKILKRTLKEQLQR
ncbi:long-chain-fatty-acid--CoA ligase [Cytobacillus purgationiresistens]|uniref:Long-chain acyl-CoA synthetase n=1 Tax=Cytobacillus purgationiresistens TaxID=863449 RepID=A0ABU0AEV1_9BACI|nr:long-chain fatty acid--CoA ligase [Cytobacillus purgationiresistens]MDQ0269786.1 long-chain acyl-CoA synthetase [Cytobacillus purgationiresistens]